MVSQISSGYYSEKYIHRENRGMGILVSLNHTSHIHVSPERAQADQWKTTVFLSDSPACYLNTRCSDSLHYGFPAPHDALSTFYYRYAIAHYFCDSRLRPLFENQMRKNKTKHKKPPWCVYNGAVRSYLAATTSIGSIVMLSVGNQTVLTQEYADRVGAGFVTLSC